VSAGVAVSALNGEAGEHLRTPLLATPRPRSPTPPPPPPPPPHMLCGAAATALTRPLPLAPFSQAMRAQRRARTASPARPPGAARACP
jgi:hypothetical protein